MWRNTWTVGNMYGITESEYGGDEVQIRTQLCVSGVHGTLGNDTRCIDTGVNHTLTTEGQSSVKVGLFIEKVGQNCFKFLDSIVPESAKQIKCATICHHLSKRLHDIITACSEFFKVRTKAVRVGK